MLLSYEKKNTCFINKFYYLLLPLTKNNLVADKESQTQTLKVHLYTPKKKPIQNKPKKKIVYKN